MTVGCVRSWGFTPGPPYSSPPTVITLFNRVKKSRRGPNRPLKKGKITLLSETSPSVKGNQEFYFSLLYVLSKSLLTNGRVQSAEEPEERKEEDGRSEVR